MEEAKREMILSNSILQFSSGFSLFSSFFLYLTQKNKNQMFRNFIAKATELFQTIT